MVDAIRKGGLKNRDEPSSPMVMVDVRGFNFKDAKGMLTLTGFAGKYSYCFFNSRPDHYISL